MGTRSFRCFLRWGPQLLFAKDCTAQVYLRIIYVYRYILLYIYGLGLVCSFLYTHYYTHCIIIILLLLLLLYTYLCIYIYICMYAYTRICVCIIWNICVECDEVENTVRNNADRRGSCNSYMCIIRHIIII